MFNTLTERLHTDTPILIDLPARLGLHNGQRVIATPLSDGVMGLVIPRQWITDQSPYRSRLQTKHDAGRLILVRFEQPANVELTGGLTRVTYGYLPQGTIEGYDYGGPYVCFSGDCWSVKKQNPGG